MNSNLSFLKYLLYPFSLLYNGITRLRNLLYDRDIFSSISFDIPIISIGNLSTGGTGKTPMVEFLVESFYNSYRMAILSRGYRRKSKGFIIASPQSSATSIGDEPYQFYLKYPRVTVSVCEDRVIAVPQLLQQRPDTQVILLDDAFQHRAISPGMSLLLTRYDRPFTRDHILPMGSLREAKNGMSRADIIIITKCPEKMSSEEEKKWIDEINPLENQKVYFTTLKYGSAYALSDTSKTLEISDQNILLVTGLASNKSILEYLRSKAHSVHTLSYSDHQNYNMQKIEEIIETYEAIKEPKAIITTEKDAVKLMDNKDSLNNLPLYILPVKTHFLFDKETTFTKQINTYIQNNLHGEKEN